MALAIKRRSWTELLQTRAAEEPDKLAFMYVAGEEQSTGASISYSDLDRWARALGQCLQQYTQPTDRVLIMLPSGLPYIAAFFGALYAGCIPVTAYPPRFGRQLNRAKGMRAKGIIVDCAPAVLIMEGNAAATLADFRDQLAYTGAILDVKTAFPSIPTGGFVPYACEPEQIAFLQYTSGSTSDPKGVMVSHDNLFHNCQLLAEGMGYTAESIVASWLPLHHDMGLIGKILCSLYAGIPCYFMSPMEFVKSPYKWLKLISDQRCTISGAPNFAYDLCATKISEAEKATLDLSCWETAWNGAETVRLRTLDEFYRAFAVCGLRRSSLRPCYGLAEATLFVSAHELGSDPVSLKIDSNLLNRGHFQPAGVACSRTVDYVSVGRPRGDTTLCVVDPSTRMQCRDGTVGELWTASPSVAAGYWNNPDETERTFRATLATDDGRQYLRTGDLGARLHGEIYITGRMKDVFSCNGRNIFPQDLETTIDSSDRNITRSAVFAIEGDDQSPQPYAVCELRKGYKSGGAEDLDALCSSIHLAVLSEHEIALTEICLVAMGEIPRTTSGKVQRAATRKCYFAGEFQEKHRWRPKHSRLAAAANSSAPISIEGATALLAVLQGQVARLLHRNVSEIQPGDRVAEFGLSSLQLHELLFALEEKLQRRVDTQSLFAGNPSLAELAARLIGLNEPALERAYSSAVASAVLLTQSKYQQRVHNSDHAFIHAVNPELGRKLSQLKLDKEFVRAEGLYLYDGEGTQYLDFLSQYGAVPLGHNHPQVWQAISEFRQQSLPAMVQPSFLHLASRLAERLASLAPGDIAYTTFCNSGAEAIEAAIKLCRSTTGRRKVLATRNGFHGKTLGALSATGREKYRTHFGVSEDFLHVPYNDLEALERALGSHELAAFIVEPIQGEAGVIMPQPGYLQQAQSLCRQHGTLFVVDEVQTGLGRTGTIFYSEQLGLEPDVITLAKGLGGGLIPIGACLSSRRVYNDEFGSKHTSTFAGNGLACAVGLKTLDVLLADDRALLAHVRDIGTRLKRSLLGLQRKHPQLIKEVRGTGLMLGVHVAIDRYRFGSGLLASVADEEFLTSLLMSYLLNHEHVRVAFTLNNGNVLRIQPPLIVSWAECERVLKALDDTFGVLATRDMGQMVGHLVDLRRQEIPRSPIYGDDFLEPSRSNAKAAFAFLLHPLTPRTYVDFDISLQGFDNRQLAHIGQVFGDNFEPFLGGESQLLSDTGDMITGQFWVVPRTARDLVSMPRSQALLEVQRAMDNAVEGGAQIVGLGAYTSIVTQGGLSLRAPQNVTVTTGNTFTALVGFLSVVEALSKAGKSLRETSVAIVGATGAIGRALALLFAPFVRRLYLVGNPANRASSLERMVRIAGEIVVGEPDVSQTFAYGKGPLKCQSVLLSRSGPVSRQVQELQESGALVLTADWNEALPHAEVVVTATNSPDAFVHPEQLKYGAIVCDISRPSNVSEQIGSQRPDVCVYDGGVVQLPQDSVLGFHTDLPDGFCYACMAEAMLIALEGNTSLASPGTDVRMSDIPIYWSLAQKHGFGIHVPDREQDLAPAYRKTLA